MAPQRISSRRGKKQRHFKWGLLTGMGIERMTVHPVYGGRSASMSKILTEEC